MSAPDIAVVTQDPDIIGGLRSQTEPLFHALTDLGREPTLVYLSRGRSLSVLKRSLDTRTRRVRVDSLDGIEIPAVVPEIDLINQFVGGLRIARRVRDARTVLVAATSAPYGYGALRSRRPYACWIGTGLREEWASRRAALPASRKLALGVNAPATLALERSVLRGARQLYATSEASRAGIAAAAGVDPAAVRIIPIPVDLDVFAPEAEAAWTQRLADRPVITFLGRATDPRKNVGLLIRAFSELRERRPSVRLRFIGERPLVPLPAGAEATGETPDAASWLRESSLFVLPSLQEGFGIVVAEALASGIPVVVTPCGGPEDLVRRSEGGVLGSYDASELAETLDDLLGQPERLGSMRRSGRAYVAKHHSRDRFTTLVRDAVARLEAA